MISEKRLLEEYAVRQQWLTEHALEQMKRHGLLAEGWKFEIASFYDEEMRQKAGLGCLLGNTVTHIDGKWNPHIFVYPTTMRQSKHEQRQTILHEIAHAQTMVTVGDTEDHHGQTWLEQCGRIMPASMFWREVLTYRK